MKNKIAEQKGGETMKDNKKSYYVTLKFNGIVELKQFASFMQLFRYVKVNYNTAKLTNSYLDIAIVRHS